MFGWRGRIGVLVPSTNFTVEPEFNRTVPEGVSVHAARCFLREVEREEEKVQALVDVGNNVVKAAREVAAVRPKEIAWAGTSGSFIKGIGYDKELIKQMKEATGVKSLTTSTAVVDALRALKVKRIAVTTPYIREFNNRIKAFFEQSIPGLQVTAMQGLGIVKSSEINHLEPRTAYEAAKEIDSPAAECVFIGCTAWRTFEIIEALEQDLKKPVVTSNQATLWASLNAIGIHGLKGYGKLFEMDQ